jgi:cytoskeletal protein RodZ
VSAATKIGTRMLRALEDEHFDQLPGGIFNKGFVRAYAQQLGMDEDQAVADYLTAAGEDQPQSSDLSPQAFPLEIRDERPPSEAADIPWGWLAIALLLVAIGFAIWSLVSRKPQAEVSETQSPAPVTTARSSPSKPAAVAVSPPTSPAAAPATPRSDSATSASSVDQQKSVVPADGSFTVLIKAKEDSWISVVADGKQVLLDTMVAPAEKSVSAQKEIVIRSGNVGALTFWFNGKPLPSQGDLGQVKTLTFSPAGLEITTTSVAPAPPG